LPERPLVTRNTRLRWAAMVDGNQASWDTALTEIADKFASCIEEHGPDSVAFYVSGQLLTEDYYVVNKFAKGYIGTGNIDTNSRLCMASSVAGHKRAFGSDTVPGCYEDLELAELIVLVGSNLAWCHPVLHGRISKAQEANQKLRVITIDPRRTATCDLADEHLRIIPDGDSALFNGLLKWLYANGNTDVDYVNQYTDGLDHVLDGIGDLKISTVAKKTGLSSEEIIKFYKTFASTERVVTVFSQGVNQSAGGTDKVNAIINCHLLTGRIGREGCGPFSITGQPNAMGGRETGGLANMLACHMDIENQSHRDTVQTFWDSPTIATEAGLKAVDLFNAVNEGKIKALWIMATNPVATMPDANFVAQALKKCEFVVQSDVVEENDTAPYAHVRLPAQAWSEKDGTVTNSERCISRQRAFRTAPGDAKPDWWAVAEVASRLGYQSAFSYPGPHAVFGEYAALSGKNNNGSRDFDISVYDGIDKQTYNALKPFYWPAKQSASGTPIRFFANGKFYTKTGRANFILTQDVQPSAEERAKQGHSLRLNTGRVRDHWHTMTRTGTSETLSAHIAEPYVEIHPTDAESAGLDNAVIAKIHNEHGQCHARVVITDRVSPGNLFVPMHWCRPFTNAGSVDTLVSSATDPISGQPALKHSMVTISAIRNLKYGFAATRDAFDCEDFVYYAKAKCTGGWRTEFAFDHTSIDKLQQTICQQIPDATHQTIVLNDRANQSYRCATFDGVDLSAAVFAGIDPVIASREWLISNLSKTFSESGVRHTVLAGVAVVDQNDQGRTICSCMNVGEKQIMCAISDRQCQSVSAIGEVTRAGTNCGSCRSEISTILGAMVRKSAPQI